MANIIQERLERLQQVSLKHGGHGPNDGAAMCAMEAAAWVAGEPWSDAPQCACPVITAFMVAWNDGLPTDADRDRLLKPLIPLIVGTRSTPDVESRRSLMAADWLVRVHTPAWLRLAKLEDQAKTLESLPEITDMAQCPSLMPTLEAVRKDANAAWAAAWGIAADTAADAAGAAATAAAAAARDAARDAARAAAWGAAWGAAMDAAWGVAWGVAWGAARAAVWTAARAAADADAADAAWAARGALKATTEQLQVSAADLVRRMIAVGDQS